MFQFPAFPILSDCFRRNMKSHSDISGSKPTCGSPEHYAACHILLRLIEPSPPSNSVRSLILSMHGLININVSLYLHPSFKTIRFWIASPLIPLGIMALLQIYGVFLWMSGFLIKWTQWKSYNFQEIHFLRKWTRREIHWGKFSVLSLVLNPRPPPIFEKVKLFLARAMLYQTELRAHMNMKKWVSLPMIIQWK